MRKLWLVARYEYLKEARKKSFILTTLGIPLLIVVVMAVSIYVAIRNTDQRPLGYVDQSGLLAGAVMPRLDSGEEMIELRAFDDQASARKALEAGQVQAFYVMPADYMQTRSVQLYFWDKSPSDAARSDFRRFLRANLAAPLPDEIGTRVQEGVTLTVRSLDGKREFSESRFINLILPFAAGFFLFFAVMSTSGQMLQAVADEKENRTVEVLITSLSPEQIIAGKALGTVGLAFTQLALWTLTIVIGLLVGAQFWDALAAAEVPWEFLLVVALFFIPAFVLIVGVMTAIGASVSEVRQGQQIAGIVNLIFIAPFFFSALVFARPNSAVLVALTLFPTTSFLTVALRWSMTVIPWWQLVTSWLILIGSAAFSIWSAARVFRFGMLQYGQKLDPRNLFKAIRASNK
ncbi:MAG: ABC transporter permease [Anaerolineae bacterium]|nr:ABC transporter permease [Anaerolineae bacterium]